MTLIDLVFPKLRTPKTWSDKCLKSPVTGEPSHATSRTCPRTVEICITALLSDSLITAKSIELDKVSLIDTLNLGTAC